MMAGDTNGGLLGNPAVQKELRLTPVQISKITATLPQRGQGGPGAGGGDIQKMMKERMQKMQDAVKILNSGQKRRLKEITLQSYGAAALGLKSVQHDLGLNAGQIAKLQAAGAQVSKERSAAMQGLGTMRPGQPQDPAAWQKRMDQFRAMNDKWRREEAAAADKILTGPQKSKWKAMQGRTFDVSQLRRRGGPGGGGRGPGGGGRGRGGA